MNPRIEIRLHVNSAEQAIEAYRKIVSELGVTPSLPMPTQAMPYTASTIGKTQEEQELDAEYAARHPLGKSFRLLKVQSKLVKAEQATRLQFLRAAVEAMRAGTFNAAAEQEQGGEQGENFADDGERY